MLHRRTNKRPSLRTADRLLWVMLSRLCVQWRTALVIVKPETVIGWQRKGFRWYWSWKGRAGKSGRPCVRPEIRELIRQIAARIRSGGAPRIHGELLKLGIQISQASVGKYMVRQRKPPSRTWRTFLENTQGNWWRLTSWWCRQSVFVVCFRRLGPSATSRHSLQCDGTSHR